MARIKGSNKTGGRKPGSLNKITASAKENLQLAFEGMGGLDELQNWAKVNRGEFYKLWVKILPTTLANDKDNPIVPTLQILMPGQK